MAKHTHPEWRHVHFGLLSAVIFSTMRTNHNNLDVVRQCSLELDQLIVETGSMVLYRNICMTGAACCENLLGEPSRALAYTEPLDSEASILSMGIRTLMTLQRLTALRATRDQPGVAERLERELGLAKSRLRLIASGYGESDRAGFLGSEFVRATLEFAPG